ncbi:TonB-dependent receptor plug domain-containing protein [Thalassovita aquimarina]|uniref:TonB-dependent receptor n=1 Tax=Thalassovita aquimarina TaxID=2785917 RepID=A0ABS5HVX5_9RHOB|nr:TonB-dependent receptor [Thalassovita aquimarina]MBR9653132.1 TonB-dependent receptor [Thalassovita aquimarina]
MTRSMLLASVAGFALLSTPALSEDTYDLGEITVSGNLTPLPLSRSGASVDVVDAEDLDKSSSLARALTRVPGVSLSANGGLGSTTNLRIRGFNNSYIGVRIDGIDVTDPSGTQTSFDFGGFTTGALGRIEVLKGSQSALYGSEAIGGVIDITTPRAQELGFSGSTALEAGSFGTYTGSLSLAQKSDRGEVALTYSAVTSEGISARSGDSEKDGFEQHMLTLSARHEVSDVLTLGGSALWRDAEAEIDRSPTDNSGENFTDQTGARVFAELATGAVKHTLSFSKFTSERRDPGGWTTMFDGDRKQFSYLANADLNNGATLNFGLDRTEESFATDTDSGAYDTNSAFAELQLAPAGNVDLSLTARYDDHSIFGDNFGGRVAGVWRVTDATTLRAVIGTGFRAPSLYELFSPYGNSALQPEQSRNAELGVEHDFGGMGMLKVTAFYTEVDDLIEFDGTSTACSSGWGCYAQVPGTTVSKGVELAGQYDLNDRVSVYGNYTYTDARNSGERLTRVPRHDLVLGVEAAIGNRASGSLELQRTADIVPSPYAPAGHKVGDYTLVNLSASYDVTDTAKAYLRIENALDEDYETAGGYNMPGRSFAFGLRAEF